MKNIIMNKPLLDKLTQLAKIDQQQSFDSQNPIIYRQRAILLKGLGCNFLAMYDNRICAYLEQKSDLDYYNHHYKIELTADDFIQQYQSESEYHYYHIFIDLVKTDKFLLLEKIDPLHFALLAGNLANLGLFNLSLRCNNDAIKHLNNFPQEQAIAYLNKAMLLNLFGEYIDGWSLYEKRWETNYKSFQNPISFPRPKWNGEALTQSDILLIHSEQGIGDNIQFVRYAIFLKKQGINVLVWNNEHIDDFLSYNLAKYNIPTAKQGDAVNFTYWISMMSLPHLCQTTLENIPLCNKYLQAPHSHLQKWQKKLPLVQSQFRIGIVWRGNSLTDTDKIRSIPLTLFSYLFHTNAQFYVIQKELNNEELEILNNYENVHYWQHELHSFSDTAAIIEQMDLIISVDTSVAHLSAAMGKLTWILINYKPDFRWLLFRNDSVWYESVSLFRQKLDYTWDNVIQEVSNALNKHITKNS